MMDGNYTSALSTRINGRRVRERSANASRRPSGLEMMSSQDTMPQAGGGGGGGGDGVESVVPAVYQTHGDTRGRELIWRVMTIVRGSMPSKTCAVGDGSDKVR